MRRSFLDSVLRGAEALAARDGVGTLPDPDLVRRFAAGRDASAFAVLVRRHGPLVWGVCRNLLAADADAEDAFQATFLALVRGAGSIRRTESLAGWLHGVAYRVSLKARRAAARRKKREVVAAVPEPSSPVPDATWDELQAAVHEEVCRLPDKLRLPFLLCGLQGRPQKEAAEVLGWKLGTVSGRLTEARRRLLDRLARRGVPAGVAIGAAVIGGVASRAAVPPTLNVKVLSAAAKPTAVSETVLSLARGVTPMYLTRTKLLAAGLVLAGILTTGVGVLSRADAQAPPTPSHEEAIKRYYDALKTHEAPRDRWEYRFIPVDKPLTTADLKKVLAGADQEGWSYCGSQELADEKTGKLSHHMVFKRPRGAAVGDAGDMRREATAALAEQAAKEAARDRATLLDKERAALLDQVKRQEAALIELKTRAEHAAHDQEKARKLADEQAAMMREAEARARAEAERALRDAADLDAVRSADKIRRKELEDVKAKYEEMIRALQDELKAKSARPPAKADPSGKKPEPQASNADPFRPATDPDATVTATIKLHHVDGKTAVVGLAKALPRAKIVADVSPDSITLKGPAKVVAEARAILQKEIDTTGDSAKGVDDKAVETAVVRLKHVNAGDMLKMLDKIGASNAAKIHADTSSDSILIAGPPDVVNKLKRAVEEMDKASGPAK